MTTHDIESLWASLTPPTSSGGISGQRAAGLPSGRPVYVAVDSLQRRHLLVQVPDDSEPLDQRVTRSLEVTTARFQVGSNPESLYVDLMCTDSIQHNTFTAIAQDLIRSIRESAEPSRVSIVGALARWRAFWANKSGSMSREEALGLFGELWFLRRWLSASGSSVKRWQAIESARHDFQWSEASIEVKTSATQVANPPVHQIASLEQLSDPETGELYLFSLQVCEDALSNNSLQNMVALLESDLQADSLALYELHEKLAARGYFATDLEAVSRRFRVLAERLYHVDADFPRLTRQMFESSRLTSAVHSVKYQINMAACDRWLIARNHDEFAKLGW